MREERYDKNHLHAQIQDLVEQAMVQDFKLAESESRYSSLFENNRTIMLLIDAESAMVVDANPAACHFYGYSKDVLTRMKITDISSLAPVDVGARMAQATNGPLPFIQLPHLLASGEIRQVEVYSGPIMVNGRQLFYSIIHDVTDRYAAEEKLVASEKKFRMLADHTYDWEYWINAQGDYVYLSPSCERMTGYIPEDFIMNPQLLFDLVLPEYRQQVRHAYQHKSAGKAKKFTHEFPIVAKDGKVHWLEDHSSVICDEQGTPIGTRGSFRDISVRKHAQKMRQELELQLSQKSKMEAIGLLAAGMAHNFNNSLAIVLGNVELAQMQLSDNRDVSVLLEKAKTGALRSRDMIKKLLSFSRQDKHRIGSLSLADMINETLVQPFPQVLSSKKPSLWAAGIYPSAAMRHRSMRS